VVEFPPGMNMPKRTCDERNKHRLESRKNADGENLQIKQNKFEDNQCLDLSFDQSLERSIK
jgi:hypothetical protein